MEYLSLATPATLCVTGGTTVYYGGKQTWYPGFFQRMAGCGPTTCSGILLYLARTRESCRALVPEDANRRSGFVRLMRAVWKYVTPGMRGLNSTALFEKGATAYGSSRGVELACQVLEIPQKREERPDRTAVAQYLTRAFAGNLPVAFLNLDNGRLDNLDKWHWVTLTGFHSGEGKAVMFDQGRRSVIDLGLWLDTTALGGGFVTVWPAEELE